MNEKEQMRNKSKNNKFGFKFFFQNRKKNVRV